MSTVSLPIQFVRQNAAPIDIDSVFITTANRIAYLTNPRRYAGQIVSDLEDRTTYMLLSGVSSWSWSAVASTGGAAYTPPANATFTSSVSAPALSGTFYGDGSRLINIVAPYLPLSGGTVTGSIQADSFTDTHGGTLVKKKSFTIVGNGVNQQFTLSHNFSTYEVLIQVYEYSTKETVMCYSQNVNLNNTLIDVGITLNAGVTGYLVVLFS